MASNGWFLGAAAVLLLLLPFVRPIMRFRIRVLRWLRLRWLANLHEKYFEGLVTTVRIVLILMGLLLLALGFGLIGASSATACGWLA